MNSERMPWRFMTLVSWAALSALGCDEGPCRTLPRDPPLEDVAQILPEASRAALTREAVVRACQTWVECAGDVSIHGDKLAVGDDRLVDCVQSVAIAAEGGERILHSNESAPFFLSCVADASGGCGEVLACSTMSPLDDHCSPVGCPRAEARVTCDGTVASVETDTGLVERDCARANAQCDTGSVSGCDDALAYSCPSAKINGPVDSCHYSGGWCEGDLNVGCAAGHARVFDCAVFGGTCVESSPETADCLYPDVPEPGCGSAFSYENGSDAQGSFQCVRGRKVHWE